MSQKIEHRAVAKEHRAFSWQSGLLYFGMTVGGELLLLLVFDHFSALRWLGAHL